MSQSLSSRIEAANLEVVAQRNLGAVADFFGEDYVAHITGRDLKGGHDLVRKSLGALFDAFAELEVEVEVLVEGDDRVAWIRTLKGRQTGKFKGFPALGREIVWRDMVTSRFRDGLIHEEWVVTDLAEQLLKARKK